MCSIKGWKSTTAGQNAVHAPVGGYPNSVDKKNQLAEEEEDEVDRGEENDFAAPLPSERLSSSSPSTDKHHKGLSAKDKRRIREKRRSTGVANLTGNEAKSDAETSRNTSYNELPGIAETETTEATSENEHSFNNHSLSGASNHNGAVDSFPSSSSCFTASSIQSKNGNAKINHVEQQSHNDVTKQSTSQSNDNTDQSCLERLRVNDSTKGPSNNPSEPESSSSSSSLYQRQSSTDYARNICAKPFEARRGILKGNRPAIPAKPELPESSKVSIGQHHRTIEETKLMARVAELEKLLESERKENGLMKKMLSDRDARIRDLELQIANLNEDLDLADEDYLRLEEENLALARALSQISAE